MMDVNLYQIKETGRRADGTHKVYFFALSLVFREDSGRRK